MNRKKKGHIIAEIMISQQLKEPMQPVINSTLSYHWAFVVLKLYSVSLPIYSDYYRKRNNGVVIFNWLGVTSKKRVIPCESTEKKHEIFLLDFFYQKNLSFF